jgi:leader peptidase (prepilin peptidase)/N-methyltransferase
MACAALMAGLAWVLGARYGGSLLFVANITALALLLVLSIIDAKTSLLPDALTLPLLWLGLVCALQQGPLVLQASVLGAMGGYAFLYGLFWVFRLIRKRDGMGYGDFKLLAALGAWVGFLNVPYVLLAACLAGLSFAALHGQKPGLATVYPFGPFLAASGAAVMVFAPEVHSYF